MSICSSLLDQWMFGINACKWFACPSYAFWLIDIMSIFWLSVDRYLFITDIKYSTYKMRTKARLVQFLSMCLYVCKRTFVSQSFDSFARFIRKIMLLWFVFSANRCQKYQSILKIFVNVHFEHMEFAIVLCNGHHHHHSAVLSGNQFQFCAHIHTFHALKICGSTIHNESQRNGYWMLMDPNHKMAALFALVFFGYRDCHTLHRFLLVVLTMNQMRLSFGAVNAVKYLVQRFWYAFRDIAIIWILSNDYTLHIKKSNIQFIKNMEKKTHCFSVKNECYAILLLLSIVLIDTKNTFIYAEK